MTMTAAGTIYADEGSFRDLDTGFFECLDCGTYWCAHIEAYLQTREDWTSLWGTFPPGHYQALTVQVPIVPTEMLWAECQLTYKEKLDAYSMTHEDGDGFEQFIGFVHRGEGRIVLRSMMIDWFKSIVNIEALTCTQVSHGFAAQTRWNQNMRDQGRAFAERWSVWANKKCLYCNGKKEDDFSDLAPDNEARPGRPW